ncbi:hypothetical protein PENANT_c007G03032 [Penicillium antarcticum]|uniref:DUF1308 domain-containing protein n=1 Tax=Penicillium antarcticum TaxID=416450 RepID=A0A1V6QBA2_9EURO|nr:uncharacterized protein N7508_003362 [Penicillium antarcticum]KAJ5312532.1 hypothetical protein N7508_003362 [Penicillium antarcticum]OQD86509.1 hypothetical protein PENANT_c007G03032 [Penicillium antarcticum]
MPPGPPVDTNPEDQETSATLSADLKASCLNLRSEIDTYQSLLASTLRNPQLVEARQFRSNVNSELKMLEKLERQMESATQRDDAQKGEGVKRFDLDLEVEKRLLHALRSSNLPFYQSVWDIAKGTCSGLTALGKRFYWDDELQSQPKAAKKKGAKKSDGVAGQGEKQPNKDKRNSVFVDIVSDDGAEWVKVSTVTQDRLLFEMAKNCWQWEPDSDDEEGEDIKVEDRVLHMNRRTRNMYGDDGDDKLELIRLAVDLRKAADATLVGYKHPRIRVVLPRIEQGNVPEIDDIIEEMRSWGMDVDCKKSLQLTTHSGLEHLLPHPFKKFTSTLNVDCTLLLAMVSDLSHFKDIPPEPHFHRAILRQIEVEKQKPLLLTELWPAMGDRKLVCTKEAAGRMREIVETIGTETEKTRTQIMMGDSSYGQLDHTAMLQKFQELSDYEVPTEWKFPIIVVDAQSTFESNSTRGRLPSVEQELAKELSDINYSVFMYGWFNDLTTISSNRTINKQIESTVEKHRNGDSSLKGPKIWICDTARSLVGKDKDRKA